MTDAKAVRRAIDECDSLGREQFREKYGFGQSSTYFLRHEGKTYDSKAIIGVAFGYQHKTKPLRYNDFSGGAATVKPVLERLGFAVVTSNLDDEPPEFRSEWLEVGEVYTRENLKEIFGIGDATINNSVYKAGGSSSIWLFVTRDKPKDRPQVHDLLDGDTLEWTGQKAGLTDRKLIDHLANGDEVLLFYRENIRQYEGGGFRYEGPFVYRSHTGSKPAAFIFGRDETATLKRPPPSPTPNDDPPFDPKNVADGRAQVLALVRRRQGQGKFRKALLKAYDGRCAISGCDFPPLLEAAHIHPYRGGKTNHVTNGLLLRTDLHTLFDLGLIAINPDGSVDACSSLSKTAYSKLGPMNSPKDASKRPSPHALEWHRQTIASPEARAAIAKKMSK